MAMEMERMDSRQPLRKETEEDAVKKTILRFVNFGMLIVGGAGTPLLLRIYYLHGGHRKWLSSWLQTAGWPMLLLCLIFFYYRRRRSGNSNPESSKLFFMTPTLFLACVVIGVLNGIDNLLYAFGVSGLPVSTSSILSSTQLAFTALFAFFLVKQKFTPYSTNAIALLTFGAVILALHSSGDRPKGESDFKYYEGFAMTLMASVLYAFILPLVELTYAKTDQEVTYTLVLEMQLVMSFFATVFSTVGMLVNKDFHALPAEAKAYGLGEFKYIMVLAFTAIVAQWFFLGAVGTIFYASALLAGIINTLLIPVTEVLAVIFFHEDFTAGKGVALALSLWGFTSYFYGEYKKNKKQKSIVVQPCPPTPSREAN